MARIRLLSDHLVSQIAAGEVVERPASVVKELVENALDAGAGEVTVELEAGGRERIRVIDDGGGMDADDARAAFDRHATSKIRSIGDLERVSTLGFRGEALASIAAVARVELTTAQEPGEGRRVVVEGGSRQGPEPAARPRGTTVEVASLFFNVPARRKFLKSPPAELRRCVEVVQGYALAYPEVRFALSHGNRQLLETPPAGEGEAGARRRVGQIFGAEMAEHLTEVGAMGGRETIWGLLGDPSTARGRRYFVFVNRRLLRDRAVLATFYRALRDTWHTDSFPALFLYLDLPPEELDVNVHPQKSEVRFRDSGLLRRLYRCLADGAREVQGERPVEPEAAVDRPGGRLAWEGLGGRESAEATAPTGLEVAEPPAPWTGGRLAEAVYTPPARGPVPLTGRSGEERSFRLLGQYKGTLILLEGPEGLYLIDQHVAHERILYERLRRSLERERPAVQSLLEPILLDLAPAERLRLAELTGELERLGFSLSELSGETLALTAVPAVLSAEESERLLAALARREGEGETDRLRTEVLDSLAASLACRAAVKMHEPMPPEAMEALIAELFRCEHPYACPHGRPIVLQMSDRDLEKRFERR